MATTNIQVLSGNRVIIKINNTAVGMLQSVRASDDYGHQEVSEIGSILVKEYVPSLARHTVTAAVVQMKKQSLEKFGIAMEAGDGTTGSANTVMAGIVFDIVIQDKDTFAVLRTYQGCTFASGDVEITKHSVVARNATFLALNVVGTFDSGVI